LPSETQCISYCELNFFNIKKPWEAQTYIVQVFKRLIFFLLIFTPIPSWCSELQYALHVDVNISESKLTGQARLSSNIPREVSLNLQNINNLLIEGKRIATPSGRNVILKIQKGETIHITYEVNIANSRSLYINKEHLFLNGNWYPAPDTLAVYSLSATLPQNFIVISEAETISHKRTAETVTYTYQFDNPLDALTLAGSTRYVIKRAKYKNIAVETYFFKEDSHLADAYLEHAQKYLQLYEDMLAPFPYARFAIVENLWPTGNSMPTYTLLGKDVIRLPFIVKTSLRHEILHQWFGNSVYIDASRGNWAEGLTTYLADHYLAIIENQADKYRKQIMIDYAAYVKPDNTLPLHQFHCRRNKAQSAVGYGKCTMLFHHLRNGLGEQYFFDALKDFIERHGFQKASWHDIRVSFEKVTGKKLAGYFDPWLNRTDIPGIAVKDTALVVENGTLRLKFVLTQTTEPYPLAVPVSIYFAKSARLKLIHMDHSPKSVAITLDDVPLKVVVDEDYDIMRQLAPREIPPVLAGIMGAKKLIVAIGDSQRDIYQPLIEALGIDEIAYVKPDNMTLAMIKENTILAASHDNTFARTLLGRHERPDEGLWLQVFQNPYNIKNKILLAHVEHKTEAQAVKRKLRHYGKYSELAFNQGKNVYKNITPSDNGMIIFERPPTPAVNLEDTPTLEQIIPELAGNRIVFIGEQHDRFAHHINQYLIIKKLHDSDIPVAVGMEMFKKPYQGFIDDYLADRINERTFLEKTCYFSEWGYDYNLYKPIVDFLKANQIPLIALNLEARINKQVARDGIDSLKDTDRQQLPGFLDFSNSHYADDLRRVFEAHQDSDTLHDFNKFLQAQILWDEAMAERAYTFIRSHPDRTLIVLAGNGHLRYRYGIPDRLMRRARVSSVVILQDEELEHGIADYGLRTTRIKGTRSPKLGVSVEEKTDQLIIKSVVNTSPAQKAGLQQGDIIRQFNQYPIESLADLRLALYAAVAGDVHPILVERDKRMLIKNVQLSADAHPLQYDSK
jgi:uncharacterized iron-regulated protein